MMIDSKMKVLPGPGHRDRREAQGRNREGPSEGSVKRSCESTYRNRIRGVVEQGELAKDSEALVAKAKWRKSGDCAVKVNHLTQGDFASRLKGRRLRKAEREVSRSHSRRREPLKG